MIAQVVLVEFPAAVNSVAVQNQDGSYTVYENTLHPEAVRQEAARELIRQLAGEVTVG